MGEARRRKLAAMAADKDQPTEPDESISISRPDVAEYYRVPEGMVGITLDVEDADLTTITIQADDLTGILHGLDEIMLEEPYRPLVTKLARDFKLAMDEGNAERISAAALGALWTCFHHPSMSHGEGRMEKVVAELLRQCNRAHLTWYFGPNGLAIAGGDRFTDLRVASGFASGLTSEPLLIEMPGFVRPKTSQN